MRGACDSFGHSQPGLPQNGVRIEGVHLHMSEAALWDISLERDGLRLIACDAVRAGIKINMVQPPLCAPWSGLLST
jgi:hypothetical protein